MAKKESEILDLHESRSVEISEIVFALIFSYLNLQLCRTSFVLFQNISKLNTRQKRSSKGYNLFMVAKLKI